MESATESATTAESLRDRVIEVLRSCYDPEIPVNIYELGLIYEVNVSPTNTVGIRMTLTSPMCPVAGSLPPEVEEKVSALAGVAEAKVEVVWDPPWNPSMMTEAARLELNLS
jgi:FeS assembly SUF system protein